MALQPSLEGRVCVCRIWSPTPSADSVCFLVLPFHVWAAEPHLRWCHTGNPLETSWWWGPVSGAVGCYVASGVALSGA